MSHDRQVAALHHPATRQKEPQMKLLLIDNYDSFTYNLVQYFGELGLQPDTGLQVIRNDQWTVDQVIRFAPDGIVISPGPGTPDTSGICLELVARLWGVMPIFGVCLGLQSIVQAMGGTIVRAPRVMHGKLSSIEHDGKGIFTGLPSPLKMTRYHSLIAGKVPDSIEISARVVGGDEVMAIRGRVSPVVEAVQFHPESILSEYGKDMLETFLLQARNSPVQ